MTLDMTETIKPKSDQLNADDLITGPITTVISGVRVVKGDQPVVIEIPGYMPFKPCKTMRRLLILAWGNDGNQWIGKSFTLYRDETVKWAGKAIGGIRISHMSDIPQAQTHMLTAARGKRSEYTVYPLQMPDYSSDIAAFNNAKSQEERDTIWNSFNQQQQAAVSQALNGA